MEVASIGRALMIKLDFSREHGVLAPRQVKALVPGKLLVSKEVIEGIPIIDVKTIQGQKTPMTPKFMLLTRVSFKRAE